MEKLLIIPGVIFISFGIWVISSPEKFVRLKNSLAGTKTQLTNASLMATKAGGFIYIIFGSVFILFSFLIHS